MARPLFRAAVRMFWIAVIIAIAAFWMRHSHVEGWEIIAWLLPLPLLGSFGFGTFSYLEGEFDPEEVRRVQSYARSR